MIPPEFDISQKHVLLINESFKVESAKVHFQQTSIFVNIFFVVVGITYINLSSSVIKLL